MKVVVLIAGKGSRFRDNANKNALYNIPKPFIPVLGKPMVYWATRSLPFIQHSDQKHLRTKIHITSKDLIFISLQDHQDKYNISKELQRWYGAYINLILLPKITRGNLETATHAKNLIDPNEQLLILDADNFYNGQKFYEAIKKFGEKYAMFPVFRATNDDPKWCFVIHKKNGGVVEISEKDPLLMNKGASAMIGAFYYPIAKLFFNLAEQMIAEGDMSGPEGKKEFYVAKTFNRLLTDKIVKAILVNEMWGLGTPSDLEKFKKFHNAKYSPSNKQGTSKPSI